jgi:hypothetical protein
VSPQHTQLGEEIGRHFGDLQTQEVFDLRQADQHRDAVGEANHDGHRDVAHQGAQLQPAHHEQQHPGQRSGNQQIGQPVALDNAVNNDDEGARWAADLHIGAPHPNAEIKKPAMMAVNKPASGLTPEAMAKAMASGKATMPTVTPAPRSDKKCCRL